MIIKRSMLGAGAWILIGLLAGCGSIGTNSSGVGQPANFAFVALQNSTNHIYLMYVNASGIGSNVRRLTTDTTSEDYPEWSPDGTKLVYQAGIDGSSIYVINADGSGQTRLSPDPGMDATPRWSPDGTQIVYTRLLGNQVSGVPTQTDIRVMNADGTDDHAILPNTTFSVEPQWSVNNQIVFASEMSGSGYLDVYIMNSDGSGLTRLTNDGSTNSDPNWSPDGTKITFGSNRQGGNNVNLYIMNPDGTGVVQLTNFVYPDQGDDTGWSSDGKKIAFQEDFGGGQTMNAPNAFSQILTMNPDGSGQINTTVQCADAGCHPRWKPQPQ